MKSNLDERQEMQLLQIEHRGYWLAFLGLLISLLIQTGIGVDGFRTIAGEFIVFMLLAIYMVIACIKNGIWDRKLKPTKKTTAIIMFVSTMILCYILLSLSVKLYQRSVNKIESAIEDDLEK